MTEQETPSTTGRLTSRLRQLLAMLGAEFLLGMGANLIGLPSEVSGGARAATLTLIGLHAVLALGILTLAVLVNLSAREAQVSTGMARNGLVSVVVAFLAGLGTLGTGNGWLSFVMAAGFLAAAGSYGVAYLEATRPTTTA